LRNQTNQPRTAIYGEPANNSAAVALLRLHKESSDSPAFPPATVSATADDRIVLLNNTIKDLRNIIEDMRQREEDLRQERDRWHVAYLAAQRLIPTPAQHEAQASNGRRGFW
jgi:hypothetical protein